MSESLTEPQVLRQEAYLYTRYLINKKPSEEIVERYIDANRKLAIDSDIGPGASIVRFSLSHPWSVPFLDAAAGILDPESRIRKKIYTMAALLEASTRYTDDFSPATFSAVSLVFNLASSIVIAGIKIILGLPIFLFIRGPRNE